MFVRLSVRYAFGVLSITYFPITNIGENKKYTTMSEQFQSPIEISLKCKYKVSDHKRRSILIWGCCHFFHSGVMPKYLRLTWRVPLVEQELLTLPEHLSSLPVFSGVRVTWSLVLCVCFVDHCLSFSTFSFGHCVVCSSSIYGFWLPLWYLQTVLPLFLHLVKMYKSITKQLSIPKVNVYISIFQISHVYSNHHRNSQTGCRWHHSIHI
jgi:hypothetical protein